MRVAIVNGLLEMVKDMWPRMLPYQRDALRKTLVELKENDLKKLEVNNGEQSIKNKCL